MPAPKSIQSPEKELRFTRSAQGLQFLILGLACIIASLAILVLATQGTQFEKPRLEGRAWMALIPLPITVFSFRLAHRCIRHAYLILTPLGIEIFPLFRPEKGMALITWQEIHSLELRGEKQLLLHHDAAKTSGVGITLAPILPARRALLHRTIHGIIEKKTPTATP